MTKISLICEQCGGRVELDDMHEFGICTFCKTEILIKNDIVINEFTQHITKYVYDHHGKDIDELVADGNNFLEIGDIRKANSKFKNAIDIDPTSWIAWLGYAATGGNRTKYLSCVPAYKSAYELAVEENQELATFNTMVKHLPDENLSDALIKAYKDAQPNKRREMFYLVLGVVGCDESEIARLVIDLCPEDWRAWFAQAKIRQVRVRWCEKKLHSDAIEVLNVFLRAYQLAERESTEAKKAVVSHFATMEHDDTYKNFVHALYVQINQRSTMENDNISKKVTRRLFNFFNSEN